ncbi:sensor histidine kinase [Flavobacterium psychrotrophum]|uniref:sensor histidine kinase n=1 Tax=Flavobacterium psychrotrophum TaxID=2294119 RepID=UPI000E316C77|nr:ATP-binding protein [Flavobacterium psychrotrophum]
MAITDIKRYRNVIILSATIAIVVGATVITGWLLNNQTLMSINPGFTTMKFNTALCFILLGITIFIRHSDKSKNQILANILAVTVSTIGLLSLLQMKGTIFYIDELLAPDNASATHPGKMSPPTSFCLMLSGVAMLIIKSDKKPYILLTQYMLHIVTLIASIALLGYIFGSPHIYRYTFSNSMALHTAIVFIIFSVGTSLANPNRGITALFTGTLIGNVMARKLFIWIIPSVIVICYTRMLLYKYNILSLEVGLALLSVSFLLISLVSVWKTSQTLNAIDEKEKRFEENLRLGIEAAPYALILSTQEGEIIHANYQAEKTFKYSRKELMGTDCKIVLPVEIWSTIKEVRKKFYSELKPLNFKLEDNMHCKRKDGSTFPAELVISPVATPQGPLALTSVIDLTLRVETEKLALEHLAELQHKNQEMEQFNYIASHDLQEPLRTVSNYIMLLQEDYPENVTPEINEHLSVMDQAVCRMSKLIRTLLDFGRLGKDKKLTLTNCNEVVEQVTADLNNLIKSTGATVTVDNSLPTLYAYDTELRQLFQNLINNAIKFSKKEIQPQINIGCREIKGFYKIYVSDNGIGIDEKHFASIFHIFQRVHRQEDYEGYGVGLANCKKIAEMHGGKIWVESEYGEGSTFKFTLINLKP